MRALVTCALIIPALLVVLSAPAPADPNPAEPGVTKALLSAPPSVAPLARTVATPRSPAPAVKEAGTIAPAALPSFGFPKVTRPMARVTSVAPRIILPRESSSERFQGFGGAAARPKLRFQLTRPAPAISAASTGLPAATPEETTRYILIDDEDEGLDLPRCDGYNPCHSQNNPAALAQQACCPEVNSCCPEVTTCEPCAPRRYVVRRYVRRPAYRPCYVRPRMYVRPYWGGYGWGGRW